MSGTWAFGGKDSAGDQCVNEPDPGAVEAARIAVRKAERPEHTCPDLRRKSSCAGVVVAETKPGKLSVTGAAIALPAAFIPALSLIMIILN